MRHLAFIFLSLVVVQTCASADTLSPIASPLNGSYELVSYKGSKYSQYQCPRQLTVEVATRGTQKILVMKDTETNYPVRTFFESPSKTREGDIGPQRTSGTTFGTTSVKEYDYSILTIVGFISTSVKIRLGYFDNNVLVFERNRTAIPAGIILNQTNHDDKQHCEYRRL